MLDSMYGGLQKKLERMGVVVVEKKLQKSETTTTVRGDYIASIRQEKLNFRLGFVA